MRFLKYIFSILLLVIALPIITSCSAVTDHPDPCPAENDITLSFTMHTTARMSDGSRADGAGHEEVDSEYQAVFKEMETTCGIEVSVMEDLGRHSQ